MQVNRQSVIIVFQHDCMISPWRSPIPGDFVEEITLQKASLLPMSLYSPRATSLRVDWRARRQ
jgi:hypothetical protein